MKITVAETDLRCEREPLLRPFGFKGGLSHRNMAMYGIIRFASKGD